VDPIVGMLIIGFLLRGGWDHVKQNYRQSRAQHVNEAGKTRPGGTLPSRHRRAAARRHVIGYWGREVSHGFPVTRTGLQAAWLAHKTTADHHRARREEARTTALETRASVLRGMPEHRQRQADAQAELDAIEAQLADWARVDPPPQGKRAVQEAADEVAARRAKRRQTGGKCPGCGTPDGYPCLPGCRGVPSPPAPEPDDYWAGVRGDGTRTPINWQRDSDGREYAEIPAGVGYDSIMETARQHGALERHTGRLYRGASIDPDTGQIAWPARPAVIDTPVRLRSAEDSDWLRPGEPRCEGCGGRGGVAGGTCPACRGFGSAPADPASPEAKPGTICGACGNPGTTEDPVLATAGGYDIHRSHATEQTEAYQDALSRMRRQENEPGPDAARNPQPIDLGIREAENNRQLQTWTVSGPADESPASPTATQGASVTAGDMKTESSRKPWWRGMTEEEYETEFQRRAAKYPRYIPLGRRSTITSPTITGGTQVTADTNYTTVQTAANGQAASAENAAAEVARQRAEAERIAEEMQAADVDGATLSAQMDHVDRLRHAESALSGVPESATVVTSGLQQRHGGLKEAHDNAPVRAADRTFYEE